MGKKIKYTDIAEKDLFKPIVDGGNEVVVVLDDIEKQLKDILKITSKLAETTPLDGYKNIEKVAKSLKDAGKAVEGLQEVEIQRLKIKERELELQVQLSKEREAEVKGAKKTTTALDEEIKLRKRLIDATGEQAKTNAGLRLQLQKQNKENKEAAKDALNLNDEYGIQSKRLTVLRRDYKNLILTQGAQTAESKKALKEVQALDKKLKELDASVGQNQRSVGNYKKALNNLGGAFKALGTAAIIAAIAKISGLFSTSRRGAAETAKVVARLSATFKVFVAAVIESIPPVRNLFSALGLTFEIFGLRIERFFLSFKGFFGAAIDLAKGFGKAVLDVLGLVGKGLSAAFDALPDLPDFFSKTSVEAQELSKQIEKLTNERAKKLEDGVKGVTAAFDGFSDKIVANIDVNDRLQEAIITSELNIESLERSVSELIKTQALLEGQSDDDTTSLLAQAEATRKLLDINDKIAIREVAIAKERLDLAALRVAAEGDIARTVGTSVAAIEEFLRTSKRADQASAEATQAFTEAFTALNEAEAEATRTRIENQTKRTKILRDEFEQTLDILIDGADNQKTINERIIADDTNTLAKRQGLLAQTKQELSDSFDAQIAEVERFGNVRINANELLDASDAITLRKRIGALTQDEIVTKRILEIVRDRRTAVQDLADAERDLNDKSLTRSETLIDIAEQEEALNALRKDGAKLGDILAGLEDTRLQNEIDNLNTRVLLAEIAGKEVTDLQQQLNEKLLEQQQKRIENEKIAEEEALEARLKLQESGFEALNALIEKQEQRRLEAIDKQIEASKKRESELRELAKLGSEEATENLAFEQRKQAELLRKREQAERRAARLQLAVSAVQTYSSKVQSNDPNALTNTITDVSLLQAFIASLPQFWEGAEHVGDALGAPDLAGKDGHIVRVDGGERVMSTALNAMIPRTMSNMELAMMAQSTSTAKAVEFDGLERRIEHLTKVLDSKPVYMGRDYDATKKAITDVIIQKGRVERNHRKSGGIW